MGVAAGGAAPHQLVDARAASARRRDVHLDASELRHAHRPIGGAAYVEAGRLDRVRALILVEAPVEEVDDLLVVNLEHRSFEMNL